MSINKQGSGQSASEQPHDEIYRALWDQRFRLLANATQDYAIFMLDVDGRVASWNSGAERINGYKANEIIGRHFSCLHPEEDVKAGMPEQELEIAKRDGRFERDAWRVRKDGSRLWANVIITALHDRSGNLIGYSKITRDITEQMLAHQAVHESKRRLEESEKSLRELSRHLLKIRDEERRRIGRDLHDSLGQYLSALKMKLDMLEGSARKSQIPLADELAQCVQLAEVSIKEVRTVSYLLYPPMLEEMGLKSAIAWYLEGFTKRSGIETSFKISEGFTRLPAEIELALFRVLQESLTNVHRHSGSATAAVRLATEAGSVILEVQDAGAGIQDAGNGIQRSRSEDSPQDWTGAIGVGLRGMTERVHQLGGKLELTSSKKGVLLRASVPLRQ